MHSLHAVIMFQKITQAIKSNFIFTVSSFFGIFPFRVIENELILDKIVLLYSLLISSFISVIYLYNISHGIYVAKARNEANFNFMITALCYVFRGFTNLIFTFLFYFHRNVVVETVHALETLEPFFIKMKSRPILKANLIETIYAPVVCGVVYFVGGSTRYNYSLGLVYTFMLVGVSLCCGQFNSFVDTVSEFLHSSSEYLVRIKHSVSFVNFIRLEKLVEAMNTLVTVSCKINRIYSKQLLVAIFTSYCSTMIHLYFTYVNSNSNYEQKHYHIPGDALLTLFHLFIVWRLAHSSSQANYKSKEFNTLLYQLMIEDKTNQFINNDKLRLHISMKREVVFTACGFFNLDYTLVHSMIASATTYLVILIQFGQPMNNDTKPPHMVFTNLTTPLPIPFTTYL
ncbi:Gustatory receptor 46c [Halyomorpha halys]|nr:Gustatory receptor 46c [Halyomorpha halys]